MAIRSTPNTLTKILQYDSPMTSSDNGTYSYSPITYSTIDTFAADITTPTGVNHRYSDDPADNPRETSAAACTFRRDFSNYMQTYGKDAIAYASQHYGKKGSEIKIAGTGAADLESHIVAAVIHNGSQGVIVGSTKGYNPGIETLAQQLATLSNGQHSSSELKNYAKVFIMGHEVYHAILGESTETGTFQAQANLYRHMAKKTEGQEKEMYELLAELAVSRRKDQIIPVKPPVPAFDPYRPYLGAPKLKTSKKTKMKIKAPYQKNGGHKAIMADAKPRYTSLYTS